MTEGESPILPPELISGMLRNGDTDIYRTVIREVERQMFKTVLDRYRGNQVATAKSLGLSRMTLRVKLRAFGMLR